jgi:hypothetical protein
MTVEQLLEQARAAMADLDELSRRVELSRYSVGEKSRMAREICESRACVASVIQACTEAVLV